MPDRTDPTVWLLWLYQFAFALLPGIALVLGAVGVFLLYERPAGFLRRLRHAPVEPGFEGLPGIAVSQIATAVLFWIIRTAVIVAIFFLGLVVILLIEGLRAPVQRAAARLDYPPVADGSSLPQFSTDFVILVSVFGFGVSVVSVGLLYATLRGLACDWRRRASTVQPSPPEPLLVRLFGSVRPAGLIVTFFLLYPTLGIVMQIIWAALILVPLPASVTNPSMPGAFTAATWMLALLWLGFCAALVSPFIGLFRHWFLMTLGQYRNNRAFQALIKIWAVLGVGAAGLALAAACQLWIGVELYPSEFSWAGHMFE
jgi:hypothetical protein